MVYCTHHSQMPVMKVNKSQPLNVPLFRSKLTPFIPSIRGDLYDAIRKFWRVPPEIEMAFVDTEEKDKLELLFSYPERNRRWKCTLQVTRETPPRFVLNYKSGTPGLYRLLQKNVQQGVSNEAKNQLQQTWHAFFPFRELDDIRFREVHSDQGGLNGRIRLGYRCNQKCWFCWQDRKWPSPPLEYYQQWVDELVALDINMLNITGGEPTTFSALPSLMQQASRHGVQISLQTNAIRLRKPAFLQNLIQSGLSLVMVSYHTANSELSDRMTQAPGTHRLTQQGIAQLRKHQVPFTLNCVVERANYRFLEELAVDIVDRFSGDALKRVSFSQPVDYQLGGWDQAVVPLPEVQPHLVGACQILYEAGIAFQIGGSCGFPLCVLREQPHLLRNQHHLGLAYHRSELTHRDFAAPCKVCTINCQGLRKIYIEKYGADFLQPIVAL